MNVLAYVHLRNIYRSTGAGRVARELIEHVARRCGVNVHILADKGDYNQVAHKVGSAWTEFPHHLFETDTSSQQARWILLQNPAASHFWPETHVTHCTTESYVPKAKSRLLVTMHDAAYFDGAHPRCFATYKQRWKWKILYGTLARHADAFHTVSQFSAERLGRVLPAVRSRIRVVYNAVSDFFFQQPQGSTSRVLAQFQLTDRPYVLLPGGLHYRKNADMVLKAWPLLQQRIPELMLVIAGHNSSAYLEPARQLGPSVRFTGFIDDPQLHILYRAAQAVWFPSKYEGFGIPVVEAMASGTPVVASNNTAIPEISGDAALLVNPDSADENVEALLAILQDAKLAEILRRKGRERAKLFTWAKSAEQLHRLYAELA